MNRRQVILSGVGALVTLDHRPRDRSGLDDTEQATPIPDEVVRDFVRAAHADLAAVRDGLAARRALANACWDWGGGDFESAIGAATHMGRRDIAELLLASGARPDLFTMIVLQDLDGLQAQLMRRPTLVLCRGPHGLSFEAHAKATGSDDVVARVRTIVADAQSALR